MRSRRFLVFLIGLCLFSALGGSVAYYFSVRNLVQQENHFHAETKAEIFVDEIQSIVDGVSKAADLVAEMPELALYLEQRTEAALVRAHLLLDLFSDNFDEAVCFLLDEHGVAVASSSRWNKVSILGQEHSSWPYFQESIAGRPFAFFSGGEGTDQRSLYVSRPVTGSGRILGVAVVKYPVRIVEERLIPQTGVITLVSPEGIVFAASQKSWLNKRLVVSADATLDAPSSSEVPLAEVIVRQLPGGNTPLVTAVGEYCPKAVVREMKGFVGWQLVYLHDQHGLNRKIVAGFFRPTGYALIGMVVLVLLGTYVLYRRAGGEIREREAAERKAVQSHAVLNQIFNVAVDGIRIIDKNFTIVKTNRTFAAMVGKTLAEITGRKCYEVFPSPDCNTPGCPKTRIMVQGEKRVAQEVRKQNAAGENITCQSVAVPFRDVKGNVVGVLETLRDISDQAETERQLEKAFEEAHKLAEDVVAGHEQILTQKAELEQAYQKLQESQAHLLQREKMASIGQLAAGVAHEINNPMGFISSNLNTMNKYVERLTEFIAAQEKLLTSCNDEAGLSELGEKRKKLKLDYISKDIRDLIAESLDGAERVRKIVQGLKSFSRIDQAEVQAASLNECLDATINIVWNELKYKAEVKKEYGELPLIVCNPLQLNQVFMNLLVNAAQAIEKQGTITIRTWADEKWVQVAVSDTGCGIPPDKVSRVFEPFYTSKDVGKGTGLGLSIAYDIVVKKHHGAIDVKSEEGKGTTFTVRIPVVVDADGAGQDAAPVAEPAGNLDKDADIF